MNPSSVRLLFAMMLIATAIIINVDADCCTCDAWCRGKGRKGGICADGPACICSDDGKYGSGCTCDAWCRGKGHKGGKCCDGASCSCTD
uniref:Uncharacterized protein n=1 Tax=Plectus sambesii TaxID=2011161 RepID=A0A914WTK6_9BILA